MWSPPSVPWDTTGIIAGLLLNQNQILYFSDSVCTDSRDNVVFTVTKFEFDRGTLLDSIISKWQWIVGAAVALVVIIIIFIIFYKCNIFKRVRVYDEQNLDENKAANEIESEKDLDYFRSHTVFPSVLGLQWMDFVETRFKNSQIETGFREKYGKMFL